MLSTENFNKFEKLFKKYGFDTYVIEVDDVYTQIPYSSCKVEGHGIIGLFTDSNYDAYPDIQNRLAADNKDCFKHIKSCPLIAKIENYCEEDTFLILLKHLKHLGSKEGYKISSNLLELDNHSWPCECL